MTPNQLPGHWRERAKGLRKFAPAAAEAFEDAALELEQAEREAGIELLNLRQASKASGYGERHLRQLIRQGILTDHGRKGAPKVKRGDLPKKATALARPGGDSNLSLMQKAVGSRGRR